MNISRSSILSVRAPCSNALMAVASVVLLRYCLNALGIECIRSTLFTIWSTEFELVSDTHELNALCIKFLFEPTPIVAGLE